MIWLWVVGYLAVACVVAYLVGRFGTAYGRSMAAVTAALWPGFLVVWLVFVAPMLALERLGKIGERHRK